MTNSLGSRAGATRRGLTLDQVWLIAAVAFVALRIFLSPVPPNDFWWHMATGRVIAESGQIPQVDVFSWTRAGEPFYNQSWLAQLILYGLFQAGGLPLIILVQAIVLGAAYGLLVHLCAIRSASPRLSAGIFMLATLPASFNNWVVRPQSYAIPLFILSLYVLSMWRFAERGSPWGRLAPLLALPAAGLIWVNLHGSFVLGGALIALTFAGEAARRFLEDRAEARAWATRPVGAPADVLGRPERPWRPPLWHLLVAGALTGLAWLANPGGLQVLGYVRNLLSSSQVTTLVTEWAAPTVRESGGAIFFGFLIALVVVLAYARRAPDLVDMLICGAFLWLALGAVRNNIWFVAVATPLFAVQAAAWLHPADAPRRPTFQGLPALNAALVGVFGLALLVTLPWVKPALDLPPSVGALADERTPIAAVEALRADPDRPERLFHDMAYGSYLIWAAPEQKVWVDPRIELYPFEQWRDYQRLAAGRDLELLDRYRFDGLLLNNDGQEGLVAWAKEQPDRWELRYADEQSSYFVRVP
jgi:hypothetical protein